MWASFPDNYKQIFVFSKTPKLVLEPTQPSIEWVPGILSQGVKALGHDAGNSPPIYCRG
jgi:hypothetical protein